MPELPEVETIVRQLARVVPGRRILGTRVLRPDVLRDTPAMFVGAMNGASIRSVGRRGKNILLSLTTSRYLLVNLGMTGRILLLPPEDRKPPPSHLAVSFHLDSGDALAYADARRFGRMAILSAEEWRRQSERLGPEPLGATLTPRTFHRRLMGSRSPVRSWLLDQTHLAGVGNIYACEALYRAGIHPCREARSLVASESSLLLGALREVLSEAIAAGGTTLRDYRTASGDEGGFLTSLRAYGREGKPCSQCSSPIARIVLSNRSAFFCPRCQPEAPC